MHKTTESVIFSFLHLNIYLGVSTIRNRDESGTTKKNCSMKCAHSLISRISSRRPPHTRVAHCTIQYL